MTACSILSRPPNSNETLIVALPSTPLSGEEPQEDKTMKNSRRIRKDESAVSPVIATILMVAITVVLAAVLYVMVSGLLTGPGTGPQTIGISRRDTSTNWVLEVATVPAPHAITQTTFLMRWPSNASIATPPGQATLGALKTASGGVQYLPVSGTPTEG